MLASFAMMLIIGFCLTATVAGFQIQHAFPADYEGKDLLVRGNVVSLVERHEHRLSFLFDVDHAQLVKGNQEIHWAGRIRLSAYRTLPDVKAGESWQFQVRLKRSSGLMNPAGFDYEKWLFAQGIDAKGYLRKSAAHQRLMPAPWYSVNAWRASIRERITHFLVNPEHAAVVRALMIADKASVTTKQWEVFRDTGTSHLMAISGLHIALVAAGGMLLAWLVSVCFPWINHYLPRQLLGAVLGVSLATGYAMLAGLTVPTQRALLMVVVGLLLLVGRQHYTPSRILAMVLVIVLMVDPLAVLNVGFYLSFSAVAIIFWLLSRRVQARRFQVLSLQGFLSLLMLPLGFLFFGEGSLVSPIANLIAIPWVSLLVVPFSFLSVLLSYVSDRLASLVFTGLGWLLDLLMGFLQILSELPFATLDMAALPWGLSILALLGAVLILLPAGLVWRYLAVLVLFPLLFFSTPRPLEQSAFWLTVLDVGQGLAVVVQTRNKTLVYDAGDRPSERYDMGKQVVLPYLKQYAISSIDALVVSHDDRDHSGGARALAREVPIRQYYNNHESLLLQHQATVCEQSVSWVWDGVLFEFLHPNVRTRGDDNNHSCVLKVSNAQHAVLLTGDIQKSAERQLLREQAEKLRADIILMPHHGSNTSSTTEMIKAVKPTWAIASAGYRSRFKHPDHRVLSRYKKQQVNILNTATDGAIQFKLSPQKPLPEPTLYRLENARFWSRKSVN